MYTEGSGVGAATADSLFYGLLESRRRGDDILTRVLRANGEEIVKLPGPKRQRSAIHIGRNVKLTSTPTKADSRYQYIARKALTLVNELDKAKSSVGVLDEITAFMDRYYFKA